MYVIGYITSKGAERIKFLLGHNHKCCILDLLNTENKILMALALGHIKSDGDLVLAIVDNQVGYTVSVAIESSLPHKLQTLPLMTVSKASDAKG